MQFLSPQSFQAPLIKVQILPDQELWDRKKELSADGGPATLTPAKGTWWCHGSTCEIKDKGMAWTTATSWDSWGKNQSVQIHLGTHKRRGKASGTLTKSNHKVLQIIFKKSV